MIAYKYTNDTKIYCGKIDAFESPREKGRFVLPANSTFIEPPEYEKPNVPKWNGENWEPIEDHRKHLNDEGSYEGGTPYWLPEDDYTTEARYMKDPGPLPENAILIKPEKPQSIIDKENKKDQLREAEYFLSSTDYKIVKCAENGLSVEEVYPGLKEERQSKRDLINQLRDEIGENN